MSHSHSSHMMCHTCMFKLCHVSVVLFRNLTAMLNLTSLSSSKLEREKWSRYNVCTIDRLAWLFFLGRVSTCTCMYVYLDPWVRVRKGTFMYLKYIVCSLAAYLLRNVDCVYTVTLFFSSSACSYRAGMRVWLEWEKVARGYWSSLHLWPMEHRYDSSLLTP